MTYRPRVLVVYGTRPEAVKVAPVVLALRQDPDLQALVVDTGQHPDLTAAVHETFGTHPDCTLSIARPGQSVGAIAARTMTAVGSLLAEWRPDLVLVHGDTTAAAATALAAHYAHLPVAHLEAGLRSGDLWSPWPEEANRSVIGRLAGLHLAPTATARDNLLHEGVPAERVVVTGNTVVDALLHTLDRARPNLPGPLEERAAAARQVVLFTAHRRESWGGGLARVAAGLADVLADRPDTLLLAPLHPNPVVRDAVLPELARVASAVVTDPFDHPAFCRAMQLSTVIVTDSGGVQEEAPSLGVPVLVTRDTTERPEAVAAGANRLVGTERAAVASALREVLDDPGARARMAAVENPYGDGHAGRRVVRAIREFLGVPPRHRRRDDVVLHDDDRRHDDVLNEEVLHEDARHDGALGATAAVGVA
ncbi:UDP-N-acetylglucosamine 2-epimerase (non-hydrolyzing) [Curtobacterium sp. MCLR17_007]|uniref:non-hydrolyzing UDP-N-acetylglucosamine 2-epimerase n=1 Tax=Curtobacterium sp. MCLR17_007 TaxID=2175648 RepID=UPI000DA9188F|nr:UDP-N-acetylglucosamine 2-epimerase (non-hydrolyzing) [Curtobacterium sp. MCLR17_007]WIB59197.1 UDP-N-acetylglucosamine 2-epimerase (non-hydrolyzing) [Curtobacterium sp. MCLR17_007]